MFGGEVFVVDGVGVDRCVGSWIFVVDGEGGG